MTTADRRGPWIRHDTATLLERRFFGVRSDTVTTPAGAEGSYDWVDAPDLVRVAALTGDGLFVVEQHHYLPNRIMWQLPGGGVGATETPDEAAARELAEEVGACAGRWRSFGAVWPMPGLTAAKVHLFAAERLDLGEAAPEESEADLVAKQVSLAQAVRAALDGTIGCAVSAQLVLAVAAMSEPRLPRAPES